MQGCVHLLQSLPEDGHGESARDIHTRYNTQKEPFFLKLSGLGKLSWNIVLALIIIVVRMISQVLLWYTQLPHVFFCCGHETHLGVHVGAWRVFFWYSIEALVIFFLIVYPLLPVDILEVPDVKNASTVVNSDSPPSLSFREGQGFLWTCAVTAGVGDELVWLLDGEPLNNSLGLLDNDTLNLAEVSDKNNLTPAQLCLSATSETTPVSKISVTGAGFSFNVVFKGRNFSNFQV